MKIVLACRVYPTQRLGGMPLVTQNRAEALVRMGHEVHVLTTSHPTACAVVDHNGVTVHHLSCPPQAYSADYAKECCWAAKSIGPDILHLDSFDRANPWWQSVPCKYTACTMHGFTPSEFFTKWNLFRLGWEKTPPVWNHEKMLAEIAVMRTFTSAVIGVTAHETWFLSDVYGLERAKEVPNPIAPFFFSRELTPAPQNGPFLCAAVSGEAVRGFGLAEKACAAAGVELITASKIPHDQMPALYDRCRALIVPTCHATGFDTTIYEALARGRGALVTETGGYYHASDIFSGITPIRMGSLESLTAAIRSYSPRELPRYAIMRHHSDTHASDWLTAILG